MSLMSQLIRREFDKSDKKRDAGLKTPVDIVRYDDIAYGEDVKWQILDVYRPKSGVTKTDRSKNRKLPVIVSVHGGGWVYGSKEVYQFYCMSLAQRGFAVVNYTYRLAPEFKFPASLEDTTAVFQWVIDHAGEYEFDTENIFAVGDSAGGHLLCLFSTMCTNQEYAECLGIQPPVIQRENGRKEQFVPRAVAFNCGVYFVDLEDKNSMDYSLFMELLKEKGSAKERTQINPLPFITSAFPSVFVMTANNDATVKPIHAKRLCERLDEVGAVYLKREYGTKEKPLDHVFHCNLRMEQAIACNDDECAFFQSHVFTKNN